jgi:hypothetical protein
LSEPRTNTIGIPVAMKIVKFNQIFWKSKIINILITIGKYIKLNI